jgi:DNA-binding IclR family transcriptional regulator
MTITSIRDQDISRRSRGLERAFEILEFLAQQRCGMRVNEIAVRMEAPRSSVYELVNLLIDRGILEYRGEEGMVYLGRKLYLLGLAYQEEFDLLRESDSVLASLAEATRETAQLCMLDGNKYTVAMMKEGVRPFRISSSVGERVPIPWTASGRLLLGHLDDSQILELVPADDFQLPNGDWLAPSTFIAEVRKADADGFFTFQSIVDSFTQCFAVPVRDRKERCIATLCLVAPREDGLRNRDLYLECLLKSARDLSGRLV